MRKNCIQVFRGREFLHYIKNVRCNLEKMQKFVAIRNVCKHLECVKALDSLYSIRQCQILVDGFFFLFFAIKTSCISSLTESDLSQHYPKNRP